MADGTYRYRLASSAFAAFTLSCSNVAPPPRTIEVRYEPCKTVVTLGVDLSQCVWTEQPAGYWTCEGARPIVTEERKP